MARDTVGGGQLLTSLVPRLFPEQQQVWRHSYGSLGFYIKVVSLTDFDAGTSFAE